MTKDDLLVSCLRMVLRNIARYRAVMIAISMGTIGFVMFGTLSRSVEEKISSNLELIGEATVIVAGWDDRLFWHHPGEYFERDAQELSRIEHVKVVAPLLATSRDLTMFQGKVEGLLFQLTAIDARYWKTVSGFADRGRLINEADVAAARQICVIGADVAREMYGNRDPVGSAIDVLGYRYTVVGVLGGPQDDEALRSVFIPISLATQHLGQHREIVRMRIRVDSVDKVRQVAEEARAKLAALHRSLADGIDVVHHGSRVDRVNLIMFLVKLFCYASLVAIFILGKTGLTNVMLGAVQDRTREIGLRKALGATDDSIKAQFMIESIIVSFSAALAGIVGGVIFVIVLKDFQEVAISNYMLSGSILFDLLVTGAIGVAAGMYPSSKASQLDIATALRFE